MHRSLSGAVLLMGLLVGCGYQKAEFLIDYSDAYCDWEQRCDLGYYTSKDTCMATMEGAFDETGSDCEAYDGSLALDCVRSIRDKGCEVEQIDVWDASCDAALDCPTPQ